MISKPQKNNSTKCLECGKKLPGRIGQKYCNPNCKAAFHYRNSKLKEPSIYTKIVNQLKLNRRILKQHYLSGKLKLDKEILISEGYDFFYFTQTGKDKNGKPFFVLFEFYLHELKEAGKYKLTIWHN